MGDIRLKIKVNLAQIKLVMAPCPDDFSLMVLPFVRVSSPHALGSRHPLSVFVSRSHVAQINVSASRGSFKVPFLWTRKCNTCTSLHILQKLNTMFFLASFWHQHWFINITESVKDIISMPLKNKDLPGETKHVLCIFYFHNFTCYKLKCLIAMTSEFSASSWHM